MTSAKEESFYLSAEDAVRVRGKKVLIVDDVVSTGGSIRAVRSLLTQAGAVEMGVMCAFLEGSPRKDVISLGLLPVNAKQWG